MVLTCPLPPQELGTDPAPQPSNPPQVALLPRDSPASRLLQDLLTKVRLQRSSFMRLRVARKGDPAESAFFAMLVEDRWGAPGPCGLWGEGLCGLLKGRAGRRRCRWKSGRGAGAGGNGGTRYGKKWSECRHQCPA